LCFFAVDTYIGYPVPPVPCAEPSLTGRNLRLISQAAQNKKLGLWCFASGSEAVRKKAEMGYNGFVVANE
jgi:hypothetical protein